MIWKGARAEGEGAEETVLYADPVSAYRPRILMPPHKGDEGGEGSFQTRPALLPLYRMAAVDELPGDLLRGKRLRYAGITPIFHGEIGRQRQ
jgi:hypothetical protein